MDEREFELINIIGGELGANQRDLSRQMNLSLGMTNMLIRRLITKGYLRIKQLNKKKVEYLLTPRGFSEKMRKSVRYTMKTIGSIGLIRRSISRLLSELYAEGTRKFYVLGSSDLTLLIEMVVREEVFQGSELVHVTEPLQAKGDGVLLVCREQSEPVALEGVRAVNVVEELAKDELFAGHLSPVPAGVLNG
ncbi:MAG: winged helix-turn-helix transcriptional regulator [Candidatus Omnitrophica bacterium]|nr:winged helix-turn-helix transcriptional regulator [Candidatus Omnitrophota bacterium]